MRQALDMVRDGGRVIVCGHYTDNGAVEMHPHWQLNRKHVELKGCWGSRYDHFHRAVALTARFGAMKPWREMVSGRFSLERAGEALAAVEKQDGDQGGDRSELGLQVTGLGSLGKRRGLRVMRLGSEA